MSKRKNAQLVRLEPDVSELVESGQKLSGRSVQAEVNYTLRAAYQMAPTETESQMRQFGRDRESVEKQRLAFKVKVAK